MIESIALLTVGSAPAPLPSARLSSDPWTSPEALGWTTPPVNESALLLQVLVEMGWSAMVGAFNDSKQLSHAQTVN
jgi:hypothetical protein